MKELPYPGKQTVVFLVAREVTTARTGRIAVLESAVKGVKKAGHDVVVLAITANEPDLRDNWLGCKVYRVNPPKTFAMPFAVATGLARLHTLNEALFAGPRVRHEVKQICRRVGATVVVGDNVRTWEAAKATGLPIIMHLDDLLSERYSSAEFRKNNDSVFGYFSEQIPDKIRPFMEKIVKRSLGLEAQLAFRRETVIAQKSTVTALTSDEEAQRLAVRSGREVLGLPMAVEQKKLAKPSVAPAGEIAFLGVLHYGPNMAALRYLRDEVLPILKARGREVNITVIGKGDDTQKAEFTGHPFTFLGYVEDLQETLGKHRMFVSPIQSGTGVKTKVLDAMSVGLPIVATPLGIAGIPFVKNEEALVGHDPEELADQIEYLMDNPSMADEIGKAGWELLGRAMNPATVYEGWDRAVRLACKEGKKND